MEMFAFIFLIIISAFIRPALPAALFAPAQQEEASVQQPQGYLSVATPQRRWTMDTDRKPAVRAAVGFVADAETGEEIFSVGNVDDPFPVASLTKLLTARIAAANIASQGPFEILPGDKAALGRNGLTVGKRYTKDDLFAALLIDSSNTAARTLARLSGLSASTFRERMNEEAHRLGMPTSSWAEPTGIAPENKASARDVAALLHYDLLDSYLRAFLLRSRYTLSTGEEITTTNLLRLHGAYEDARVVAGKTGYIEESGFSVAVLEKTNKGQEMIAVVLGSATHFDRFQDAKKLLDWAASHARMREAAP